jgi:hypothetical protein
LRFSRPWRGPGALVRFGRPFRYKPEFQHGSKERLRQMTDEAMYVLAEMVPEYRRGFYSDLSRASRETIEFL